MTSTPTANELRNLFFDFFRSKGHLIVPSASMIIRNDPSLMFTNAGMNQFKDIFLGNRQAEALRVANSQKCLRVSGKHNDLEEVGLDTYHHTMFEMLGNWSFGDYFKKEAIEWAWEFLTRTLGFPEDRLYATVFEGNSEDNVPPDSESSEYWKGCFSQPANRILPGSKKDNFWEMGDTGPCGPCSEIHVDIRDDNERKRIPGHELVNKGDPGVIEIWNLVFIQYNRRMDGHLDVLPSRHVDTGMGFERLCMVVQGKKSNYDTDVFQSLIGEISSLTGKKYGVDNSIDIALRVIADHVRAVSFAIADGQLPSNNRAGYVIRRILRRAVRYGYNYLDMEEPFIYRLVPELSKSMGDQYPELRKEQDNIAKIILEEENTFLKTLGRGLKMIEKLTNELKMDNRKILPGKDAFELYDTFGFPVDLTRLILKEQGLDLDDKGFENEMKEQKDRSREDASVEAAEWTVIRDIEGTVFTGYESTEEEVVVTRYRKVKQKGRYLYHIIFDKTPFYAESGGQVGDSGMIKSGSETIMITDTVKENNLIIHIAEKIMHDPSATFTATVDTVKRTATACNHTATHLLHHALRKVLGSHVEQKGSLVNPERLRFDFSHFSKMTRDEITQVENIANAMVRGSFQQKVTDGIPMEKAREMGAIALFGEKYGDTVRVVKFGDSVELCGGTHVTNTGSIGIVKIITEGAIAAGIRRIEAVTAARAEEYINEKLRDLEDISSLLKASGNTREGVEKLIAENASLKKSVEKYQAASAASAAKSLEESARPIDSIRYVSGIIPADNPEFLKNIAYRIRTSSDNTVLVTGSEIGGKAHILVMVSNKLIDTLDLNAVNIIREIAPCIKGGGGGQPFLAAAGGKDPGGLQEAIDKAAEVIARSIRQKNT